jgi:uncharacterized Zn-binding protein involved in type VI secretion
MGAKPQARLTDLTVHSPPVISGSPDTSIEYLPAARLNDLTAPCPLCKTPPPGKIVTSSKTVFVNGLGAARLSDKVACGSGGSPPGGGSHPPAKGYEVRPDDSYEKMIEGEHEISEFDLVEGEQPKKLDGSGDEADAPEGIKPGSPSRGASQPSSPGSRRAGDGVPYHSGGSPNPYSRQVNRGQAKSSQSLQGGDIRPQTEEQLTGRKSVGVGEVSAGAKFGEGAGPAGGKKGSVEYDKEEKRVKIKLNLKFPMELSFGKRSGQAGYGGAANMLAKGAATVFFGD